jgi:hypothetical protein
MARAVKPRKSRRAESKNILCPGEQRWTVWRSGDQGVSQVEAQPDFASITSPVDMVSLPVQHVFALPMWLVPADPELLREMIYLQIERRGLAARIKSETVFDYKILGQDIEKILVMVALLPPSFPEYLSQKLAPRYHVSAGLYPLPPNQFTFWREGDRLVTAVTRDNELIYFQALGDHVFSPNVLHEIRCIHLQLETQNFIHPISGATVWGDLRPDEIAPLREVFGQHVQYGPMPQPNPRNDTYFITPFSVQASLSNEKQKEKQKGLFSIVATVYGILLVALIGQLAWYGWQKYSYSSKLAAISADLKRVTETQNRWQALEPAINPEIYPLEILSRFTELKPAELNFTKFSQDDDFVTFTIEGETKESALASKFAEDLKRSPLFAEFRWEPILRGGGMDGEFSARLPFTIKGARRTPGLPALTDSDASIN